MISISWPQYLRREASIYGNVRQFRSQARYEVLVCLLMNRNRFVSISELIEFTWPNPDNEPENPEKAIDYIIKMLRVMGIKITNWQQSRNSYSLVNTGFRIEPDELPIALKIADEPEAQCEALNQHGGRCKYRAAIKTKIGLMCSLHERQYKSFDNVRTLSYKTNWRYMKRRCFSHYVLVRE